MRIKKGNEDFILFEFISCSKSHPSPYQGEGDRKVLISSSMRIKKVMKILFCLNSYHVLNSTPLLSKEREIGRGCFYDEAL